MSEISTINILDQCKTKKVKSKKDWSPSELKAVWITYESRDYSKEKLRKILKCGRSTLEKVYEIIKNHSVLNDINDIKVLTDEDFTIISNNIEELL